MSSFAYNSVLRDVASGKINFGSDSFRCMLVTELYSPDHAKHSKRADITNEVVGANYTAGGQSVLVTVTTNSRSNTLDISFSSAEWPNSTITAAAAIYYKSRGGLASDDELIGYIDFEKDVISVNGPFSVSESMLQIYNNMDGP